MISNNWTPLNITVNCGSSISNSDISAIVDIKSELKNNDLLLEGRISSLETGVNLTSSQVFDLMNADNTFSGQISSLTNQTTSLSGKKRTLLSQSLLLTQNTTFALVSVAV